MLVEFPKFNIKQLCLLIFPVFMALQIFTTNKYIKEDNSLFEAFRYFLCHIFSAIFLIITYKLNYKRKNIINLLELTEENKARYQNLYLLNKTNNQVDQIREKIKRRKLLRVLFF